MTGTWYPPSLGTGGVLIEAQLFTNPPFKMTEHDPTGRSAHEPGGKIRPALWQEIDRAWWSLVNTAEPHCNPPSSDQAACVIRAVQAWLVPEEGPRPDLSHMGTRWDERQRLRALLTAEAERAEQQP